MSTLATYLGPELASQLPAANHLHPETHVATMLGVEISLTLVMVTFVCMRFYSRLFINGLFGLDDATMGVAAATAVGHTLVTCAGTRHGIGAHLWDVDPAAIPAGFKYTFTSILLFHPVSALTKMSVCFGYLRLFPGTGNLVFCWPINLFWNQPFSIQRDCVDVLTLLVATAALNSLGDLLVYLWPIKFLFKLQMPLAHRLGLILLFSFGCVVFAASICRIVSLPPAMSSVDVLCSSEFTERIRSKIWGTDYAPGREDPYSYDSPLREAQKEAAAAAEKTKKAAAAAEETKEANVDAAGVAPTPATSTAPAEGPKRPTRRAVRAEDASYEPAKTWHGLQWIGGEKNAWTLGKDFTMPARKTLEPAVALRKALVEVYTARSEGVSFESIYGGQEDRSRGVELSAAKDGGAVIKQKAVDPSATDEEVSQQEIWALSPISLRDPAIKFAVVKRVMQLTGTRISDPIIAKSDTAGILLSNITKKPQPTKLFEKLERDQMLSHLRNVKISPRRITPIDKEKQVGRWKVIEQKLLDKNLPVTGHRI
ncbi:hypothetical protein SLS58_007115 [Diplodia intermedia]|uniref:Large ribosomal subunit protein mL50 n=1 Tax=Diplodia intermedia TaxID=856260 RepID=A0ABR3TL49_9PEZI